LLHAAPTRPRADLERGATEHRSSRKRWAAPFRCHNLNDR
jgi:hypothetical protein